MSLFIGLSMIVGVVIVIIVHRLVGASSSKSYVDVCRCRDRRMDKCCMGVDVGESCKLLIIMELRIGVVGADAKKSLPITPITLLKILQSPFIYAHRLLAISPQRRIIFVPIPGLRLSFTVLNNPLNMIAKVRSVY